ncbi:hypothetical protein [Lactococcus petauri]|uniref:hypothetical protein n=1 Tax=Lactococcus petauri TaxID=1940789 RepID=UPI0022E79326|nr:hypothetical protein [Lactococcus petauri]
MISKHGEIFTFNIFLYVLTYSRKKFITLTFDKKHPSNQFGKNISIFEALDNSGNGRKKLTRMLEYLPNIVKF